MDFNNIESQIELNQERLKEEVERYDEIRSRISYISIIHALFAAYIYQLITYWFKTDNVGVVYSVLLLLFVGCVITSAVFTILLLLPVPIAYKDFPNYFYKDLKQQYLNSGITEEETDIYIKHTYRGQLEEAVETNFSINNKKSKYYYYAFVFAIVAIFPYIACIGIQISNQNEQPTKVELVNNFFNDMSKEKNDSSTSNQVKRDVDTSKVIVKQPVLIRENEERGKQTRNINEQKNR